MASERKHKKIQSIRVVGNFNSFLFLSALLTLMLLVLVCTTIHTEIFENFHNSLCFRADNVQSILTIFRTNV